jgi:hypothetical protein
MLAHWLACQLPYMFYHCDYRDRSKVYSPPFLLGGVLCLCGSVGEPTRAALQWRVGRVGNKNSYVNYCMPFSC